ncbi:four helix bundle protein [Gracilimonas sediminicola]|uniref:Four helix bundle protein n=1 Tax=Gracilimonas sediminicola TaxID=2952158 RepID=A0A9X2L1X7_9BACT|nr:four helix bundle protein [Gracilimonas sediminicola]MCP9290790.1 four helix bundle protein [Gracilimonas sediminicola]
MRNVKYDLQERLINFSVMVLEIVDQLPKTVMGIHFAKQLVKSGTSPAFHHGEAQSAESRKDFIHKLKIGAKELRETQVNISILKKRRILADLILDEILKENNELIAIFVKSIQTATHNLRKET